nr:hypothetical protein [Anaerohalosphaera lusitana]
MAISSHCQIDVAVPHDGLGDFGVNPASRQQAACSVPKGMEVHVTSRIVDVLNACILQVGPEHLGQVILIRHLESHCLRKLASELVLQKGRRITFQRNGGLFSVLTVGSFNGDSVGLKIEARNSQASHL